MLYLIVCTSPRAARIGELVGRAQERGWTVCVIPTPQALKFIDRPALEEQTGFPARSEYKQWGIADPLPPPDAMLVCPATFNTVNKWAYGLADTLALALLTDTTQHSTGMSQHCVTWVSWCFTVLVSTNLGRRGLVGGHTTGSYRLRRWRRGQQDPNGDERSTCRCPRVTA